MISLRCHLFVRGLPLMRVGKLGQLRVGTAVQEKVRLAAVDLEAALVCLICSPFDFSYPYTLVGHTCTILVGDL